MRDYHYGTSVLLRFCYFIVQHFFSFNRTKPGQKVLPLRHMMCTDTAAVEQWKIGRGQQRPTDTADMSVVDGGHECGRSFPVCWRHVIFEIGHWLRCRMLWTGWTTVSVSRALPWCLTWLTKPTRAMPRVCTVLGSFFCCVNHLLPSSTRWLCSNKRL